MEAALQAAALAALRRWAPKPAPPPPSPRHPTSEGFAIEPLVVDPPPSPAAGSPVVAGPATPNSPTAAEQPSNAPTNGPERRTSDAAPPPSGVPPPAALPDEECDKDIRSACETLLTMVVFSTCQLCGGLLSKENEKSCNLVLCSCGHCVCYLCGRQVVKASEMANWAKAHEAFKKVHEEGPHRPGMPLCCVPPNAGAEAEHLAYRVGRAIDRLFVHLTPPQRPQAHRALTKLAQELTT